jgi:hypothetical protein
MFATMKAEREQATYERSGSYPVSKSDEYGKTVYEN